MNALAAKSHVSPIALVADKKGTTVYVAGHTAEKVVIIDLAKGKPEFAAVPGRPTGLALSKDGDDLFVTVAGPARGARSGLRPASTPGDDNVCAIP